MREQPALYIAKEAITAIVREAADAARTHHAVTRNHDRKEVRAARLANRARRAAELLRELSVGQHDARWDVADRLPHAPLERGAALGERQLELRGRSVEVTRERGGGVARERRRGRDVARRIGQIGDLAHCLALEPDADL